MSNWLSRIVVAAILLPIVLGVVYLGGWYLFALIAIAAAIALHEYWLLGRALSPLAPAGYIGGALALLGAQLDGVGWMLGGALTTFALAFLL
jgi:phosphatidate cytidylyltransferase